MGGSDEAKKLSKGDSDVPKIILETLISGFESPEGLKPPILYGLYYLLDSLSKSTYMGCSNMDMQFGHCGFKVTFEYIKIVTNILFKELDKSFKQLCSALHSVSASWTHGKVFAESNTWAIVQDLLLLLRCCMVILTLLGHDLNLLLEKGRVLLLILRKLISLDLTRANEKFSVNFERVSYECTYADDGCATSIAEDFVANLCLLESSDPCLPFLRAVLEVFSDELLVHGELREYFMLFDSPSPSELLFMSHFADGDIATVLEVISAHFVLSFSDEQVSGKFFNKLFWLHDKDFRVPELSLTAALSLLINPIMLSAPKVFQAHLILLVSEAININTAFENMKPDLRLMDCYLTAFERSVILYTRHMLDLHTDGHPIGTNDYSLKSCSEWKSCQPSFEHYIRPVTRNKFDHLVTKLDDSWSSYLRDINFETKYDPVASSIAYMKENQHVIEECCRDESLSILSCIISRAFYGVDGDTGLYKKIDASPQDIHLLASIMRLMSSSLLQAIFCVRHLENSSCVKTSKDVQSCKEYVAIVGIISCFRKFKVCLPIQNFLCEMMQSHPERHKGSRWMLLHFAGLLSLSFVGRLDFLVNGCIFAMMTLLNLLVLEEGDLDALGSLLISRHESFLPRLYSDKVGEAQVDQNPTQAVALKFQKTQKLYLSRDSLADLDKSQDEQAKTSESSCTLNKHSLCEETEESCNGEIFLKCVVEGTNKSSDFSDLADFIECKPGKDYADWLKDRRRYRKWKCEKIAVLRWKKKKKIWKSVKGKKT